MLNENGFYKNLSKKPRKEACIINKFFIIFLAFIKSTVSSWFWRCKIFGKNMIIKMWGIYFKDSVLKKRSFRSLAYQLFKSIYKWKPLEFQIWSKVQIFILKSWHSNSHCFVLQLKGYIFLSQFWKSHDGQFFLKQWNARSTLKDSNVRRCSKLILQEIDKEPMNIFTFSW